MEAAEEAGLLPTSGGAGKGMDGEVEEAGPALALFGGRSGVGGGGTFSSSLSAASFCSVALRSAIRSAMRASRSLSSSSCRDSNPEKKDFKRSNESHLHN